MPTPFRPAFSRAACLACLTLWPTACVQQPAGNRTAVKTPAPQSPAPRQAAAAPVNELQNALTRGPLLSAVSSEPQLRIRIKTGLTETALGKGDLLLSVAKDGPTTLFAGPLTLTRSGVGFELADPAGRRWTWASPSLVVRAKTGDLHVGTHAYPGTVELAAQGAATFDLINDLPLERYLPGVLAKELYADWRPEAYRAQAVAARSYAIWEMTLRRAQGRAFDLESDESSQAYLGTTTNATAARAVRDTRGTVLAFEGRVLPAFFSACAGGAAQDAVIAFPDRVADLVPLRGHPLGDAGSICKNYRWPTLARDKADAIRRLAAWGAAEKNPVAQLRSLSAIRVATLGSRSKRPAEFELTDADGRTFMLGCEDFRIALNGGTPAIDAKARLLSSFCDVRVAGSQIIFENGRGHGHGVGMEQWGAQGMARQGAAMEKILQTYYPSAELRRAY